MLSNLVEMSQKAVKVKQELEQEKSAAQSKLEDSLNCVVCMERLRSVVLQPCNHFVCCALCAVAQQVCPATGCQTPIKRRIGGVCLAPSLQDVGA